MLKEMLYKVWIIIKQSKLLAHYQYEIQKNIDFELPEVFKDVISFNNMRN